MPEEKFNFTKAYQEVEGINDWFQKEDIDLDEALEKFQRGMDLIKKCKERLKDAENKFEEIKKKYSAEKENRGGEEDSEEVDPKDIPF